MERLSQRTKQPLKELSVSVAARWLVPLPPATLYSTTQPITVQSLCARGSIVSFASPYLGYGSYQGTTEVVPWTLDILS
jgi:hypothetical protein